ncbi:MAG: Na(+)-translocating NADH-quinone reductase subunit C [Pararheinheimera sp.]|nr:Na(+)-translocating NADH-quinone reductase subunit C [Rheinheimera sp.]
MFSNNDSIGKTFFVVIGLCLICAIFVAASAVGLRPIQAENKLLDAQKNILVATGLLQGDDIKAQFDKHVKVRLVDMETGDFVEQDALSYDYRKMMKDPAGSITLTEDEDKAKIRSRAKLAPVYLAYANGIESGEVTGLVLPIHGYGLWSTMHGFLALDADGNTIKGLNYYEHGETPGLGAEIQNPKWVAQFVGKKLLDDAGNPAIRILKPGNAQQDSTFEVDGLSGATITSNGVQHTFEFWAGSKGFAPFLAKVRDGALKNG